MILPSTLITALCLPLYFFTAAAASQAELEKHLPFALPISKRLQLVAFRKHLRVSVLFSTLGLLLALLFPKYFIPPVFEGLLDISSQNLVLTYLAYPALYVVLGYSWPRISRISLTLTFRGSEKFTVSLETLQKLFAGDENELERECRETVETYVDRVVEAIIESPATFAAFLEEALKLPGGRLAGDLPAQRTLLRESLLALAQVDFESLFRDVARYQNIAFRDRPRPLMEIEGMRRDEEERLWQQGVVSIADFLKLDPSRIQHLSPSRVMQLQTNARLLRQRKAKRRVVLLAAGVMVILLAIGLSQLLEQPAPAVSGEIKAPDGESAGYPETQPAMGTLQ